MHDVLAELQAYLDEAVQYERAQLADRAAAVRAQIARVRTQIARKVEALETEARALMQAGQDGAAGVRTEEARRYRAALGEPEDASHKAPHERAVLKKASH